MFPIFNLLLDITTFKLIYIHFATATEDIWFMISNMETPVQLYSSIKNY